MLANKIALVTGASRGLGRGIAVELGRAGATVYITALDRQHEDAIVRKVADRLPTLEDVAQEIDYAGGRAIPIFCDQGDDREVAKLFQRIAKEQNNQLDICVPNAFPAVTAMQTTNGKPFWDLPLSIYDTLNYAGLRGHYVTCWHAAKLMVPRRSGLILTTSSPGGLTYFFCAAYGINKAGADKMCADMAIDLREHNVACISFWSCAVKSELYMDCGLITDDGVTQLYKTGSSLQYQGQCAVALATDPNIMRRSGDIVTDFGVGIDYGITDHGKTIMCPLTSKYADFIKQLNKVRHDKTI